MRSLIKMQMTSRQAQLDLHESLQGVNQSNFQQQQHIVCTGFTQQSMRSTSKRNTLSSNNDRQYAHRSEVLSDVPCSDQLKKKDLLRKSKNLQRKDNIEQYISDLTSDIENPRNQSDLGETKFKVLKRIIEHYDIKTMEKNHYSKLIKTFGLQIEPVKTQRKSPQTHNQNRSFKIKSSSKAESRFSALKNRIRQTDDGYGQVALLQFSKQLKPMPRPSDTQQHANRESQEKRYMPTKQSLRIRKDKNSQQKDMSPNKKMSPFKFKSMQDIFIQKINKFREFLFVLNCSNRLYRKLDIPNYEIPLKFYVGLGNNSNLIKFLIQKRFYFQQTSKPQQANFIWSQIKMDKIFQSQQNSHYQHYELKKQANNQIRNKFTTNHQFEQALNKVLTKQEAATTAKIFQQHSRKSNGIRFQDRLKYFDRTLNEIPIKQTDKIHNHLPSNGLLGNKKGMFYCLREYFKITKRNVWDILPLTFHICKGVQDNEFKQFCAYYNERKKNKAPNIWIMKPGEFSNRGNGITCSNKLDEIRKRASKCHVGKNGQVKTLILQLYISNPLLYNNRKFDIRVYMMVTCHNGKFKGYWYQEGYIRTSSYVFDLNELADSDIHLTNDAIQKKSDNYGKYEPGNKLSYAQMQRYLDTLVPQGRNLDFYNNSLPKMKEIGAESLKSAFLFLDENKKANNFQIFGLDFMLDYNLKPWLIQINTNPCLELSCPLLERIIPHMVENAFRIALDPIFPPPDYVPHNYKYIIAQNAIYYNKFQLIFDEDRDGPPVRELYQAYPGSSALVSSLMNIQQDQEQYKEEGIPCEFQV